MNPTSILIEANSLEIIERASIQPDETNYFGAIVVGAFLLSISILSFVIPFLVDILKRKKQSKKTYWYSEIGHKPFKND